MNWTSGRAWLASAFRLVLGGFFLWSGLENVGNPRLFGQAVRAYSVLPEWLVQAIGYGLPVLEICLAALLVFGVLTRIAAATCGVLLVAFLIGSVEASARGLKIACGCFGAGGPTTKTTFGIDILLEVVLIAVAAFLVLYPLTRISIDEYLAREDYVEPPSAKRMRDPAGRRKYEAAVAAKHKEARSRGLYITVGLSLVVVLVALISIGVQSGRAKVSADATPALNATAQYGVTVGHKAPATMDIYEDFQCPACATFEQSAGPTIQAAIAAGQVQVRYHVLAFLNDSSDGYSARAANAAVCASDINTATFKKYHDLLFAKGYQPKVGSGGKSNVQLTDLASGAAIVGDNLTTFSSCVTGAQHASLVDAMTLNASKHDVTSMPRVLIGGKKMSDISAAAIKAAIAGAQKGQKASPNPTPTPPATAPSTAAASSSAASSPAPSIPAVGSSGALVSPSATP